MQDQPAMSRDETLLKLLAFAPATRQELVHATGWGIVGTREVLDRLLALGHIGTQPHLNGTGVRFCLPHLARAPHTRPPAPQRAGLLRFPVQTSAQLRRTRHRE
jgi:hypothetical protein